MSLHRLQIYVPVPPTVHHLLCLSHCSSHSCNQCMPFLSAKDVHASSLRSDDDICAGQAHGCAVCAQEMSAIAAKNSALLVLKHLTGQDGSGLAAEA